MPTTLFDYYAKNGKSLPAPSQRFNDPTFAAAAQAAGITQQQYLAAGSNNAALNTKILASLTNPASSAAAAAGAAAGGSGADRSLPSVDSTGAAAAGGSGGRSLDGTTPDKTLPEAGGNSLLTFASSLNSAVQLARQKRNKLTLGLMGAVPTGAVPVSDFNSVLHNFNTSSDKTSQDLIDKAVDLSKPVDANENLRTVTGVGVVRINQDGTYDVVVPEKEKSTDTPGSDTTGTPAIGTKQKASLKAALDASKFTGPEADGKYADPNLYLQNYNSFMAAHGNTAAAQAEFFKEFPPATYINPANTQLPPEILQFVKKAAGASTSNPFKS